MTSPHAGHFRSCPSPGQPCTVGPVSGQLPACEARRGLGQGQDRAVGGRSLRSQVPEPLAGLARTGPAVVGGRAASWLPALVSGGNDSVLQADPEKMLGACLSRFLVSQLWTRKAHRRWNQGSTCRAAILSWCAWPINQGGDDSQSTNTNGEKDAFTALGSPKAKWGPVRLVFTDPRR